MNNNTILRLAAEHYQESKPLSFKIYEAVISEKKENTTDRIMARIFNSLERESFTLSRLYKTEIETILFYLEKENVLSYIYDNEREDLLYLLNKYKDFFIEYDEHDKIIKMMSEIKESLND